MLYSKYMPSDKVIKKLADIIKTSHRKNQLLLELEQFCRTGTKVTQETRGDGWNIDYKNYPLLNLVIQEMEGGLGSNVNQNISDETLQNLKELLANLTEIVVELPEDIKKTNNLPGQEDMGKLDDLESQLFSTVGETAIVTTTSAKNLTSGLTLSYKGKYVNLTLDKIIKDKVYD